MAQKKSNKKTKSKKAVTAPTVPFGASREMPLGANVTAAEPSTVPVPVPVPVPQPQNTVPQPQSSSFMPGGQNQLSNPTVMAQSQAIPSAPTLPTTSPPRTPIGNVQTMPDQPPVALEMMGNLPLVNLFADPLLGRWARSKQKKEQQYDLIMKQADLVDTEAEAKKFIKMPGVKEAFISRFPGVEDEETIMDMLMMKNDANMKISDIPNLLNAGADINGTVQGTMGGKQYDIKMPEQSDYLTIKEGEAIVDRNTMQQIYKNTKPLGVGAASQGDTVALYDKGTGQWVGKQLKVGSLAKSAKSSGEILELTQDMPDYGSKKGDALLMLQDASGNPTAMIPLGPVKKYHAPSMWSMLPAFNNNEEGNQSLADQLSAGALEDFMR